MNKMENNSSLTEEEFSKILEKYYLSDKFWFEVEELLWKNFIKDFGLDQPKQLDMWNEFGTGL